MDGSTVRSGRLLPGFQELNEGVNAPVRGIAAVDEGEVAVIAKRVSPRVLAVELICAAYGRAAGLPIPEPLVLVDDDGALHFGSVDIGHPNLSKFITVGDASLHSHLLEWPSLVAAACFDELVVNPDRHDGNLLFDGESFTLIDHDLCLPHGMLPEAPFPAINTNILLAVLMDSLSADDLSRRRLIKDTDGWLASLDDFMIQRAASETEGLCTPVIQSQLISFVRARLLKLADLISDKVRPDQGRLPLHD